MDALGADPSRDVRGARRHPNRCSRGDHVREHVARTAAGGPTRRAAVCPGDKGRERESACGVLAKHPINADFRTEFGRIPEGCTSFVRGAWDSEPTCERTDNLEKSVRVSNCRARAANSGPPTPDPHTLQLNSISRAMSNRVVTQPIPGVPQTRFGKADWLRLLCAYGPAQRRGDLLRHLP